jgi:hypothetical protein
MAFEGGEFLHELCSQALMETDPRKLVVLLSEINVILTEVLNEVNRVLPNNEYVS